MKSIKVKLISFVAMICLVIGIMIVGIFAAQTQQIKLNGQVNFEIADKSLYVKDVRIQESMDSSLYSLSEQGKFMPGYVNETFNMSLGNFTNTYGSFALYFDVINTMDETSGETFAYTIDDPADIGNTTVSAIILDSNGSNIDQIPQGTVKPSQITSSTPISATIKVTMRGTAGATIDLSQVTITISQYIVPQVYDYFGFEVNDDGTTVSIASFDASLMEGTEVVIPSTVSYDEIAQTWMSGNDYTVTGISYYAFSENCDNITSITLPSTITDIPSTVFPIFNFPNLNEINYNIKHLEDIDLGWEGDPPFNDAGSNGSGIVLNIGEGVEYIPSGLFCGDGYSGSRDCNLKGINISSTVKEINNMAFTYCIDNIENISVASNNSVYSGEGNCLIDKTTNTLISGCKNSIIPSFVTSIGDCAFQGCSGLTSIKIPKNVTTIGESAFFECIGLQSIIIESDKLELGNFVFIAGEGTESHLEQYYFTGTGFYDYVINAYEGGEMDLLFSSTGLTKLEFYVSEDAVTRLKDSNLYEEIKSIMENWFLYEENRYDGENYWDVFYV